jgi:7-cyano-7-deazaguanine synthase
MSLKPRALILFSGGQDSTACLAWALERSAHVETIGFDYGQRHRVELEARINVIADLREKFPHWSARLGDDHVIDLAVLGAISDTALTRDGEITYSKNGLPNTFVPGRNLMFFTLAAAVAYRRGLSILVGGMCETDFSGYPDCRNDTIKALQVAVSLGMGERMTFETPLMWINKAQTWRMTHDLGGDTLVNIVIDKTHTCYMGNHTTKHAWGFGCGACPACDLREVGYNKWIAENKTAPAV